MRRDSRNWQRLIRIGQVAVAVSLMVVLLRAVDGGEALRLLAGAEPKWLGGAIAALTLQTVLSALRWRLTAGRLGVEIGLFHAIREYYLSQILNQSLPGGVIGDAGRAVRARGQAGLVRSSQAVFFERLAGQAALFVIMVLAALGTTVVPGGVMLPGWVLLLVLAAVAGVGGAVLLLRLGALLPGAAGRATRGFADALRVSVLEERVLPWQTILSVATAACNLLAFAFCARATGTLLPAGAVMALVPLILFTMLIPVSVSGWGLREGAAAALFPVIGASAAAGLAASVAFGLMFIAAVLPGLLPLLQRGAVRPAGT